MVYTQHLLLGLIAEDRDPQGFLGSGITIDKARGAVWSIWDEANSDSNLSKQQKESGLRSGYEAGLRSCRPVL
uniref:Chaperone protein ClpD, chloroplastic n=1 Tax=Noccaea caerulescens TaxID=107243 RepID=A0A1J3F6P0_NOCCA